MVIICIANVIMPGCVITEVCVCSLSTGARGQGHVAGAGPALASGQHASARGEPNGSRPAQEVQRMVPKLGWQQEALSNKKNTDTHCSMAVNSTLPEPVACQEGRCLQ